MRSIHSYLHEMTRKGLIIFIFCGLFLPVLAQPTLTNPSAGSTVYVGVTFSWGAVGGVSSYDLLIDTQNDFASANAITINNGTATSKALPSGTNALSFGTSYFWKVRANLTAGGSVDSEVRQFSTWGAVSLSAPANGVTNQPTSLTLDWLAHHGVTSYELQLDTSPDFNTAGLITATKTYINSFDGNSDTQHAVSGLTFGATYYWRVRAVNSKGTSAWSGVRNFTTHAQLTVQSPNDGATNMPPYLDIFFTRFDGLTQVQYEFDTDNTFNNGQGDKYTGTVNAGSFSTGSIGAVSCYVFGVNGLKFGKTYYYRIRGVNANSTSEWSTVRTLSIRSTLTVQSPNDGATNMPPYLDIFFTRFDGLTQVQYEFDTDNTFNNGQGDKYTGTVNAGSLSTGSIGAVSCYVFGVNGLKFGKTYHYRIRGVNANSTSEWSAVRTLTIRSTLTVQSPNDGATNMPPYLDIFFTRFDGLTQVQYEFDTDNTFNNGQGDKYTGTVNAGSLSTGSIGAVSCYVFGVNGLKFGKTYHYRIRGVNANSTSEWSAVRTLTIRSTLVVQSPNDGATNMPPYLDIFFTRFDGLTQVQYEFDTDNTFNNGQGDKYTGTVNAGSLSTGSIGAVSCYVFGVNGLKFGKTYYYRIRGVNANSTSEWSTVRTLTIRSTLVVQSPNDGATNMPPYLDIFFTRFDGLTQVQYEFDTDNTFNNGQGDKYTGTVNAGSLSTGSIGAVSCYVFGVNGLKFGKTYYYRIRGVNANSTSEWSTVRTLTIRSTLVVQSPNDGATNMPPYVDIFFTRFDGLTQVQYEFDTDNTFNNGQGDKYTGTVNAGSLSTGSIGAVSCYVFGVNGLKFGKTYYYRIRGVNANSTSEWSTVRTLTTIAAPVLATPANNATNVSTAGVNLTWNDLAGETGYQVQMSTSNLFTTLIVNSNRAANSTSQASGALTANTTYYWRVRAKVTIASVDYYSAWAERAFTTGSSVPTLPAAPTLLSPSNNATGQPVNVTLSWSEVTGASYVYEYSPDVNFITNVQSGNVAEATTSVALSALQQGTRYYWRVRSVSGGLASAWSASFSFVTTATKIPVTVSITDNTATYDGVAKSVTVTTTPAGVSHSIAYALGGNVVSSPVNAGTYDVTVTITDNAYELSSAGTGTLTINKAVLTATADDKTREYGAANPTATITYTGFKNGETVSVLDTQPTASFASSANSTANAGTMHAITPSGGSDNNYNYSFVSGTLTISKATLTATADDKTREYGAGNPTATITYTGFKNSETASVLDTQPTANFTSSANSTANAGTTHAITLSGGSDNNYNYSFVSGTLTISKATLTATADDKTREYGAANPTATITYTGFKNGETASVLDTQPTASFAASANGTANASTTHAITLSGGSDNNYNYSFVSGTLTISKATLTATADDKTREYGAANPTATITYAGFKNGETASVLDTQPTANFASSANSTANAGTTHAITPSGGSDNNYNYSFVSGTLTISKATLTATADDKTREYGAGNPTATITYTGFKNGETAAVLDTQPTASFASSANGTANASTTHAITLSGGSDNNYNYSFVSGRLTISKATLTATADDKTREYGAANPTATITYTGFKNGETAAVLDTQPTSSFASSANSTANAGTTHAITLSGGSDNNYEYFFVDGQLSIVKASQSVSFAEIADKFLGDGGFTLSATTSSGLPVSYGSSSGSVASVSGNVVTMHTTGTVVITASQAGDGNYHAATPVEQSFTILDVSRVMQPSSSLIAFGEVIIGRSASVVVSVTNTGTGLLTITNIEHPAEVQVDNTSFTVPAGGTVQITVTYTPTAEGTISGNLVFVSDATGGTTALAMEGSALLVTGEAEVPAKNLISIFPNPVMTEARIIWEGSEALSKILVQDAQGRVVSSWSISEQSTSDTGYIVNLSDLNFGLYLIRFVTGKGNIYQRTLIKL